MDENSAATLAEQAYSRARSKASLRELWARLQGRSNELLAFQEVKEKLEIGRPIYRGIQTVPIDRIVGSVDRYRDFDRAFLPRQDFTAYRWRRVGKAYYKDINLPPVKLYKVGEVYFVVDGNHRISVARELGREFVDAEVHEWPTDVPLPPDVDAGKLDQLSEEARFLTRTGLNRLEEATGIRLTIAGGYQLLLEHIAVHRYFLALEQSREVSFEEAAEHWFRHVYLPTVEAIRATGILEDFPGRTEADLYLWVVEHLFYLRERFGEEVTAEQAAESFARHFTPRWFKRLRHYVLHHLLRWPDDETVGE